MWTRETGEGIKEQRKAIRKQESIRIRLTVMQKRILIEAAEREGLGVSSWLLAAGLRSAASGERREAEDRLGANDRIAKLTQLRR